MQRPPANAALVKRFNQKLDRIIGSDLPILQKIKKFVIKSGGKRIRPITHFYFTAMLGYTGREWEDCGAIGELIHAASLLHDDVVDEASMRRGKPSINALEGNKTAVLSGDYLLACGIDHLGTLPHVRGLLPIFTRVIRMLAIGELLQMQHEHNLNLKARDYNRIILGKTGSLFGAMTESAWIISNEAEDAGNARTERRKAYRDFGERMGYLFQVRDDYLDYFGDAVSERKDIYQDFRRGLITRPMIVLRDVVKGAAQRRLVNAWRNEALRNSAEGIDLIRELLHKNSIQKKLAQEIENKVHGLMHFLREHPESWARDRMLVQLRGLLVPVEN